MDNILKRLDDWWIKGTFPTYEWSVYFAVAQIEKDIMWLIEVEPDEEGFYPIKIYTAWRYINNELKVGDLIYINFYDKLVKFKIEKNVFEDNAFVDWFEEQLHEHINKLDGVLFKKRINGVKNE